ncbi:MAG: hypothetical protein JOY62_08040 [Acidobacteriaceae bacterium]|nr:hypothetical protein [Acidobacteriaceae bacterium]MBV9779910.1 hypothetical protein [Acidobacteriaceae bacterium]
MDRRIGLWTATTTAATGIAFVLIGLIGVFVRPPSPEPLRQVDPCLAILEILIILFAVALITMIAAVYSYAALDRKTFALAALAFITSFAVLTCGVHFASLTVGRQIEPRVFPALSHQLSIGHWPTIAMSIDLLAWDLFLGLGLVFAAPIFRGKGADRSCPR